MLARQIQMPPSLRKVRPDLPAELDAVVRKMLALRPEDRYPTAQAVMRDLLPFLPESAECGVRSAELKREQVRTPNAERRTPNGHRVLIVDDEAVGRFISRCVLEAEGIVCDEAVNGRLALEAIRLQPYDLVLLDIQMPEMNGPEVLRRLREQPPYPNLKVIMLSGGVGPDEMAEAAGRRSG